MNTTGQPFEVARVIVRRLPSSFAACEREDRDVDIDVPLAQRQHAAYVEAIRDVGVDVVSLPSSHDHPDCVFVEDTAVVLDADHVVVTRPGAESRRGEVSVVAEAFEQMGFRLERTSEPARLDGGDVLRVREHLFVGLSGRTDRNGFESLRRAAESRELHCHEVVVGAGLHLKTGCSLADETTLLYTEASRLDVTPMREIGLTCLAVDEPVGGNVLFLGRGAVLVSAASPRTADLLSRRGLAPRLLDLSELHKADAGTTCPSIRVPASGAWCT